ncbi:MAG: EF-hand protein, partial [Chthoniobacteraceae bacterium]|nr:EF-hand protein [Chthoniobacteraceae bacterium]
MKAIVNLFAVLAVSSALGMSAHAKPAKPRKLFVPGAGKSRHNPSAIFKKLDANADQSLSFEEFKVSFHGKKNPDKAGQVFAKKDIDSNGSLTEEEFSAVKKGGK